MMKKATISFCLKDPRVLLAMKKVRFGKGKWNGLGGRPKRREHIRKTACREIREESGLIVRMRDLEKVALIDFYFGRRPKFRCHVYFARRWTGKPTETDEMRPRWFPLARLPYRKMWPGDALWIPLVLAGNKFRAKLVYDDEGKDVLTFVYRPAKFR
jgi:8-oxo-dGTP pyrophosphatase MutT (NUDIX family)